MKKRPPSTAHRHRSNILAKRRTELAFKRTLFAADRTLMAWVRTSLALISFGFTFVKFFQYLGKTKAAKMLWSPNGPRNVGMLLVGLGTAMVLIAAFQNYRLRRQLRQAAAKGPRVPGALVVAVFIGLIGLLALVDLLFRSGFF